MTRWQPTAALARALVVSGAGLALAVTLGRPALVVLVAPLAVCGGLGLRHRPRGEPAVSSRRDHPSLHEGQGTTSRLTLTGADGVEQVTRVGRPTPYVALRPHAGVVSGLLGADGAAPEVQLSPRRWGVHEVADEQVALTSPWAGFRWGPVSLPGRPLAALPVRAPFDSRAEVPRPLGLVGSHRSRRLGDGAELGDIRRFAAGDRLRRVSWRVSTRTGDLHVVSGLAEEDCGVLLVADALSEIGRSGGVDGPPSSLDVTVRAAAAIAEHHLRRGDRVGLRVVGGGGSAPVVGYGSGQRHLRVLLDTLARVAPGVPPELAGEGGELRLGVAEGTVVVLLSPMLHDAMVLLAAQLTRRGLPVLVVDTLPADSAPAPAPGTEPRVADLAWRMRRLEREELLHRLASTGCPVVAWRGPGTLDEVMRRLARRAQLPRVVAR